LLVPLVGGVSHAGVVGMFVLPSERHSIHCAKEPGTGLHRLFLVSGFSLVRYYVTVRTPDNACADPDHRRRVGSGQQL
jgi:hypothetical protein